MCAQRHMQGELTSQGNSPVRSVFLALVLIFTCKTLGITPQSLKLNFIVGSLRIMAVLFTSETQLGPLHGVTSICRPPSTVRASKQL